MTTLQKLKTLSQDLTLLYVEDDIQLRDATTIYLEKFFKEVKVAQNGQEGLELFKSQQFDLVVTDIQMPKMTGLEMAQKMKEINQDQNILIISAYSDVSNFTTSIKIGVDGYIIKPIDYEQMNDILYKITYKIHQFKENQKYKYHLEELIEEKTQETNKLQNEKIKDYKEVLFALIDIVEERDTYTGGHSKRVAEYSKMIAQELNLSTDECELVYQAGIVHDIGKIAIPDTILLKPIKLNDLEYKLIQEHAQIGYDILKDVHMFEDIAPIVKSHHERYDGSGYPDGLKGDQINLLSQIMAIADTFDAITTSRIYKSSKTIEESFHELQLLKNVHFAEKIVDCACEALKNVKIEEYISQLPSTDLEKERFSYFFKDQVSQAYNINYLDIILRQNQYSEGYKYLTLIKLNNFSLYHKSFAWDTGDELFEQITYELQKIYNNDDELIFRVHGDNYIILTKTNEDINVEQQLNPLFKDDKISIDKTLFNIKEHNLYSIDILKELSFKI